MAEDDRTRRWQRTDRVALAELTADPLQALRRAIRQVKTAPKDPEARRQLRALAAEQGQWEQLAMLLADEARAAEGRTELAVAFYEELADVYENLDQPLEEITALEMVARLEPHELEHHDRLAKLYHREGAWVKAAEAFERVAALAQDDRARAALRAAGRLYRDNAKLDRAVATYRAIVDRKPSDQDAWRALDELLTKMGKWRELADVRGQMAERATGGVEKAALLRAQARAMEQGGDAHGAADVVARAAKHAPDNVSGLVDYAEVLARSGKGQEAAEILQARVADAVGRNAPAEDVAALRLRVVGILDESGDRAAANAALDELLAAAPEYMPALERLVFFAAGDPRAHATALLRYAAALDDGAAEMTAEAARRYLEVGDYRNAVRAFEQSLEISDDDRVRGELDDARTALVVERAAEDAANGDRAGAERKLRSVLGSHPHHLPAVLALADVLAPEAAAEHLRETLADAPEDLPPDKLAPVVFRYSRAMAACGEADEAHQLLHEAHRLDRKSLPITLALGESCFARRLWREATLHLGKLAEHPDAPKYASEVASGLVHAALAEARALRPQNSRKHYEAAVALDPKCAKAWHALGEIAIEAGDIALAAQCLEAEAEGTTEPRERLRLFHALGDLALEHLGDEARAERCWMRVVDDAPVELLEKLLSLQRRRGDDRDRGVTCERLAGLTSDPRTRRELLEEAAEAFASADDYERARATAKQLMLEHPTDVDAVWCATSIAMRAGDNEKAAMWLVRALDAWELAPAQQAVTDTAQVRLDVDDARRAELWRRLGDIQRSRGDESEALSAYQKAIALSPESDAALSARRGLIDLAGAAPGSGSSPVAESLAALVEADPQANDVLQWARQLETNRPEDARAMFELAIGLGAPLDEDDERFVAANPPAPLASDEAYPFTLPEYDRRAMTDDADDSPMGELANMLAEMANLILPDARTALARAGLDDAMRISPTTDAASAAMYPQVAKLLDGPVTLLYAARSGPDIRILISAPAVVVLGPRLAGVRRRSHADIASVVARNNPAASDDVELRFRLGRVVELARPRRIFASEKTSFVNLVAGIVHAFAKLGGKADPAIASEAERLRSVTPVTLRKRITDWVVAQGSLDPPAYARACQRAADRAGLLACGDASVAIAAAGGPDVARHLARFAASPRYLAARKKLRSKRR